MEKLELKLLVYNMNGVKNVWQIVIKHFYLKSRFHEDSLLSHNLCELLKNNAFEFNIEWYFFMIFKHCAAILKKGQK